MVLAGFLLGILVGATPGLAGPMAMAISLPVLISTFGFNADALLPVMGFLIGIMKGATVGGAVPAILFNTPGTPDAYMTSRLMAIPWRKRAKRAKPLNLRISVLRRGYVFGHRADFLCAVSCGSGGTLS